MRETPRYLVQDVTGKSRFFFSEELENQITSAKNEFVILTGISSQNRHDHSATVIYGVLPWPPLVLQTIFMISLQAATLIIYRRQLLVWITPLLMVHRRHRHRLWVSSNPEVLMIDNRQLLVLMSLVMLIMSQAVTLSNR